MNIDVLALKYRPKFFNEVRGQELVIKTLSNSIELQKLHNSYLFSGTRGMGKTTIARLFAKSLLCQTSVTSQPCGKCSACIEIDQGNHLDLIEIDAASRTKVEDTRSLMENVQYLPTTSRFKVYLIDEVHMLSTKSFNALLKTIEEPPSHVKFLLATTEPEKLPDTILSRCLHFKLASASQDTISNHLADILAKENIKYDNLSLSIISKNANGSIRDSLSLLEQCIAYCNGNIESSKIASFLGEIDSENIEKIVSCIINHDAKSLINIVEDVEPHSNFISLMDSIISIFYKLSLSNIQEESLNDSDPHYIYCKENSNSISSQDLQLYYQIAISSKKDFRDCPSKKDHFIMTILRMIYFSDNNESPKNTTYKKTEPKDHSESKPSNPSKSVEENVPETISNEWMDAVQNMDLSGLTMHLAMQSVMVGIDTDSPTLQINEDKKDIYPKLCIDDLILKIKKHFNINFKINIEYSADLLTPILFESMKNENEVNTRYDKVKDSPDINKLQKFFGANINKESIKKIIE